MGTSDGSVAGGLPGGSGGTGDDAVADVASTLNCAIVGCDRPRSARGWCKRHYECWRRHGDPLAMSRIVGDPMANFAAKVDVGHPLGCWVWTAGVGSHGYGVFAGTVAHRFAYETFSGPIPEGMQIDHLCRNRRCVNPDHLEVVTNRENVRRGLVPVRMKKNNPGAQNSAMAARTHCKNGHAYQGDNFYYRGNTRVCRLCRRDVMARWRQRNRATA